MFNSAGGQVSSPAAIIQIHWCESNILICTET